MGILDHWHPVAASRALRRRPIPVALCGRQVVLFRTRSGMVGALDDCCPHRRSKLSTGAVDGEQLRCAYHGWGFSVNGDGESPGQPKLTARAAGYDAREAYGFVWVKPRGATAAFPELDTAGFTWIGAFQMRARSPLELVVDNFNELEHAGVNHTTFGFDQQRIAQATVLIESTETATRMLTKGPTKPGPLLTRLLIGYNRDYWFCSDTWTYYSPVYSLIDHWWETPGGAREARVRWRVFLFYVPVDADQTDIVMFVYGKTRVPGASLLWPLARDDASRVPAGGSGRRDAVGQHGRLLGRDGRDEAEPLRQDPRTDARADQPHLPRSGRVGAATVRERFERRPLPYGRGSDGRAVGWKSSITRKIRTVMRGPS